MTNLPHTPHSADLLPIVQDEKEIAELLAENLAARGFETITAGNGEEMFEALDAAAPRRPDLILLDIMLPGEDGLSLCRRLRTPGSGLDETPLIILSALGELTDRVVGLELGADDYLAKPFEMRELLARIRALLRRTRALKKRVDELKKTSTAVQQRVAEGPAGETFPTFRRTEEARFADAADAAKDASVRQTIWRFGSWRVNMDARHLIDESDVTIALSSMEFRLLKLFLLNPQRILTREQILYRMNNRSDAYDRSIDVQISRLRSKLRDSGRNASLIRTMRGDGYMLAVPVLKEAQE